MGTTPPVHAYVKLTSPLAGLTEQQRIFCEQVAAGKNPITAARIAGYSTPEAQGHAMVKTPRVAEAIRYLHKKHERLVDMDRKRVMDGFLEAIEMAKLQADSGNMISGWREIGRMCGYYAPEVKKVEITVSGKRVIDQLEVLTDEALLQMVAESQNIIEMDATEVLSQLQLESSDGNSPEDDTKTTP